MSHNCACCNFFQIGEEREFCGWCVDCPTGYCDVPRKEFERQELKNILRKKEKGENK
jgi:hypothetical protein